jgi:hypothetical protein
MIIYKNQRLQHLSVSCFEQTLPNIEVKGELNVAILFGFIVFYSNVGTSMCLKIYISPSLTPTITNIDPRWLGAWWLGWAILGTILLLSALLIGKELFLSIN